MSFRKATPSTVCKRVCVHVCVYNMGGKYAYQIPITIIFEEAVNGTWDTKGKGQFALSKCLIIFFKKIKTSKCWHLLNLDSGGTSVCFVLFCTFPKFFFF